MKKLILILVILAVAVAAPVAGYYCEGPDDCGTCWPGDIVSPDQGCCTCYNTPPRPGDACYCDNTTALCMPTMDNKDVVCMDIQNNGFLLPPPTGDTPTANSSKGAPCMCDCAFWGGSLCPDGCCPEQDFPPPQ